MTPEQRKELLAAVNTFRSVLGVIDALPESHRSPDTTPLQAALPKVWPTLGELRELVQAVLEVTKR